MKAIFNKETNSITEQEEMEKPEKPIGGVHISTAYLYERLRDEYDKHIASLRTIPCSPSCADLWKDGQVVEEGKDYEVKEDYQCSRHTYLLPDEGCDGTTMAIPITPAPTEQPQEDIWRVVLHYVTNNPGLTDEAKISMLKYYYHITKRQR